MANTTKPEVTEADATPVEAPADATPVEAPAKRGRKATRDPEGKSFSGFFSKDEVARIQKARFKGEYEQINDLVRAATLEHADKLLGSE